MEGLSAAMAGCIAAACAILLHGALITECFGTRLARLGRCVAFDAGVVAIQGGGAVLRGHEGPWRHASLA